MHKHIGLTIGVVFLLVGLMACAALDSGSERPFRHQSAEDLGESLTKCTNCHDARGETLAYGSFEHDATWTQTHKSQAYQHEGICAMCHQTSFCNDCHATNVELKPSIKNQGDPSRQMPHRGDYLSRHRIDGRIDPTSCFRCHGNPKAAQNCVSCHG